MAEFTTNDEISDNEYFAGRYDYLLGKYNNVAQTELNIVLLDLRQTLTDYDQKSKEINLGCIAKRKELSPSGKRSVNCVAVASASFCEKFSDFEVEMVIPDIIGSLHSNITTLLPYLSHGIMAVRMVEILLYDMCTIYEAYEDDDKSWCSLATQCFKHPHASPEIKLASAVLICKYDVGKEFVDIYMFMYLQNTLLSKRFLGIKKNYIEYSIAKVEMKFAKGQKFKELATEPRESGYKSGEEGDFNCSESCSSQCSLARVGTNKQRPHKHKSSKKTKGPNRHVKTDTSAYSILNHPLTFAIGGAAVTIALMWCFKLCQAKLQSRS